MVSEISRSRWLSCKPFAILAGLMTGDPSKASLLNRNRTALWFALVVLVALAVRLIHLSQLSASPLFEHPIMDAKVHHEWAQQFAAGEAWSVDRRTGEPLPYFRAPLYIWFLGTIYSIFGVDAGYTPRLIQSLMGALSCGLVFLLGNRLFSRGVGLLAGLTMAGYWTAAYFDNELLIEPMQVFLNLLLLWLLVIASERKSLVAWAAAGLLLGLEAIARPNILLFAPAVCVWILWLEQAGGSGWRRGVLSCLAFGLALLAPILPVTIRNQVVGNDRVLIASQGGVNFYIGNNPHTDGVTAIVPGTPPDWWGGYDATQAMAAQALGRQPKPSEVSGYFFDLAFRFWKQQTGRAIDRTLRKLRLWVYGMEYPNNMCIYTNTELFTPISRWLPGSFWIVCPLGLLGLLLGFRRSLRLFPLWGFVLVYSISIVIFFVTARYRMPVVYPLSIFAAHAVFWLVAKVRERATLKLAAGGCVLALAVHLTTYFPGYGYGFIQKNEGEALWTLGVELAERKEDREALEYLNRAVAALQRTAATTLSSERRASSLRLLSQGLAHQGEVLERLGQPGPAENAYKSSLQLLPENIIERAIVCMRIARVLERQGKEREARRFREEAEQTKRRLGFQGPLPDRLRPEEHPPLPR